MEMCVLSINLPVGKNWKEGNCSWLIWKILYFLVIVHVYLGCGEHLQSSSFLSEALPCSDSLFGFLQKWDSGSPPSPVFSFFFKSAQEIATFFAAQCPLSCALYKKMPILHRNNNDLLKWHCFHKSLRNATWLSVRFLWSRVCACNFMQNLLYVHLWVLCVCNMLISWTEFIKVDKKITFWTVESPSQQDHKKGSNFSKFWKVRSHPFRFIWIDHSGIPASFPANIMICKWPFSTFLKYFEWPLDQNSI